jgi:hypothetical protein
VRFVLGNRLMVEVGGTEVHLVTLAEHLQRLGHDAVIYSPELGPYTEYARSRGLVVESEPSKLPAECDVLLSQDTLVAYDLAARYPQALHAFRICGDVFDFQLPPLREGVVDLVIVLSDRYAQLAKGCAITAPIVRLTIPVDVDLRTPVGGIRDRPRRAVMLGNYGYRFDWVHSAWGQHGIEVERIGSANGSRPSYDVASALAGVDIVVAKSRAALEAMACGRAVYVYDVFGGDGWVTPSVYPTLEADHFAGLATGRVIGPAELAQDLAEYDPSMGIVNRDLILQHHNARDHVLELLAMLEAHSPPAERPASLEELARLAKLQWSWELQARGLRIREGELHQRLAELEAAADQDRSDALELRQALADAQALAEEMQATRTWRVAGRYWRLKERLRAV